MARPLILPLLMAALAAAPASAVVTFDWAHVGNAGNAPDPQTGYGAVAYEYAIAKHEVTNAQYVEFLNAVDPTGANALGLFETRVGSFFGAIIRQDGNVNGAKFTVKSGRELNPVSYISFFEAMRFTNWLHNGQGGGDTETGVYTIGSGWNEIRSVDAKYWIPSEDEWYKAAYHDASAGTAGAYFDYATGSDNIPISDQPGDNPSAVNYYYDDRLENGFNDGLAVNSFDEFGPNILTNVGAYTAAASPYGTFDQNGNVWEWNEAVVSSTWRGLRAGLRGGFFSSDANSVRADSRTYDNPTNRFSTSGFRVATLVPEPSTLLLASLLSAGLLAPRRAWCSPDLLPGSPLTPSPSPLKRGEGSQRNLMNPNSPSPPWGRGGRGVRGRCRVPASHPRLTPGARRPSGWPNPSRRPHPDRR